MQLRIFLLLGLLLGLLTGCNATDPSKRDLKSPCVSSGMGHGDPCVRHIPIENYIV